MPKKDFNTDIALEGGALRDMLHIRENSAAFQLALSEYNGRTKLSSKNWYNCEYPPCDNDLPDDCTVLRYLFNFFYIIYFNNYVYNCIYFSLKCLTSDEPTYGYIRCCQFTF